MKTNKNIVILILVRNIRYKRCLFVVPTTGYMTRAVPRICETLTYEEQMVLYQKIKEQIVICLFRRNRGDYLPDKAVAKTFVTKTVRSFSGVVPTDTQSYVLE